jgi:hypothetical protein
MSFARPDRLIDELQHPAVATVERWLWLAGLAMYGVADVLLTTLSLWLGNFETNPLAAAAYHHAGPLGLVGHKLAVVIVLAVCWLAVRYVVAIGSQRLDHAVPGAVASWIVPALVALDGVRVIVLNLATIAQTV